MNIEFSKAVNFKLENIFLLYNMLTIVVLKAMIPNNSNF